MSEFRNLAVCIPTFRRAQQLAGLLADLSRQTLAINRLIVVDGDPARECVRQLIASAPRFSREIMYVPSNHANLPYQRFLGWKAAAGCEFLIYLDDDLQLKDDSIEHLVRPLHNEEVVGTTAEFLSSPASNGTVQRPRFGVSRVGAPGDLTPSGHRRPIRDEGQAYAVVGCLRGGAMAFRMSAVTADCFHADLFAMGQRGWGLGEDVLLSRTVGARGLLLTSLRSGIVHPNGEGTPAFRRDAFGHGYATAYSRRLLNDHYRGAAPPRWSDRAALVRSYCAHALVGWGLAMVSANRAVCAFVWVFARRGARAFSATDKPAVDSLDRLVGQHGLGTRAVSYVRFARCGGFMSSLSHRFVVGYARPTATAPSLWIRRLLVMLAVYLVVPVLEVPDCSRSRRLCFVVCHWDAC